MNTLSNNKILSNDNHKGGFQIVRHRKKMSRNGCVQMYSMPQHDRDQKR